MKRIHIINWGFFVKVLIDDLLYARIYGQVDIIPDGRHVEYLINRIVQSGRANAASEVGIELFLYTCGAEKRADVIANQTLQRLGSFGVDTLVAAKSRIVARLRVRQQHTIAVKNATAYRRVIAHTLARKSDIGIRRNLLRCHNLPVN